MPACLAARRLALTATLLALGAPVVAPLAAQPAAALVAPAPAMPAMPAVPAVAPSFAPPVTEPPAAPPVGPTTGALRAGVHAEAAAPAAVAPVVAQQTESGLRRSTIFMLVGGLAIAIGAATDEGALVVGGAVVGLTALYFRLR